MTLDPNTRTLLEHQQRRMHVALHETFPPDRKLAREIQKTVDDILDRQAQPIPVTIEGKVIWPGDPNAPAVAANTRSAPERVLAYQDIELATTEARRALGLPDDDDGMVSA